MLLQRNDDIRNYSTKTAEAEAIWAQIEALEALEALDKQPKEP